MYHVPCPGDDIQTYKSLFDCLIDWLIDLFNTNSVSLMESIH